MLTIEHSEKGSITTGNDVLKDVAGGDPITVWVLRNCYILRTFVLL